MVVCPQCRRKIDVSPARGERWVMPDHLNYLKSASCPASGLEFGRHAPDVSLARRMVADADIDWAAMGLVAAAVLAERRNRR
jgi:hypothetical protein